MHPDSNWPQQKLQCFFPLKDTGWSEGEIEEGLSIRRLKIADRMDLTNHYYLSPAHCRELLNSELWIHYTFLGEAGRQFKAYEEAEQQIRDLISVMLVFRPRLHLDLMLFLPSGQTGSPELISSLPKFVQVPIRVNVNDFGSPDLGELSAAFTRFRKCSEVALTRLINPVRLLEHGLQAREPHLATLLWTMGLDSLLMPKNSKLFVSRLCRLLGPESYVFGRGKFLGEQPSIKVGDIAEDLYKFRSKIAHGNDIPIRFREKFALRSTTGEEIYCGEGHSHLPYRAILHSAALFLLLAAIRGILTDANLHGLVQHEDSWLGYLDGRDSRKAKATG